MQRGLFIYLSQEEKNCLAKLESLEHKKVVDSRQGQHRHPLLLPQHARCCTPQAAQHPAPALAGRAAPAWVPAKSTVPHIAQKRQQKKECSTNVRPPNHTGHCFSVNGMRGKEKACQQAPQSSAQKRAAEGCEEGRDQRVKHQVEDVVAPGTQAMQGVVEAEGEGA